MFTIDKLVKKKKNKKVKQSSGLDTLCINIIKAVMSWKSTGKRPRGQPRKRCMDVVEEDLKRIGVNDGKNIIQYREKWREIVKAATTLIRLH